MPQPTLPRSAALLLALCLTSALASQGRPSGLRRAIQRFEQAIADEHVLGAVLLVTQGDQVLLHEALGHRDAARERPMQPDALFRMASNTKAVTAAAVLTLVDEGKVGLDDPVAKWFPTFTGPRGGAVTIRHLLTHSSGLRIPTLFLQPLTQCSEQNPDAPNLVQECARFGEVRVEPCRITVELDRSPRHCQRCPGLPRGIFVETVRDHAGEPEPPDRPDADEQ